MRRNLFGLVLLAASGYAAGADLGSQVVYYQCDDCFNIRIDSTPEGLARVYSFLGVSGSVPEEKDGKTTYTLEQPYVVADEVTTIEKDGNPIDVHVLAQFVDLTISGTGESITIDLHGVESYPDHTEIPSQDFHSTLEGLRAIDLSTVTLAKPAAGIYVVPTLGNQSLVSLKDNGTGTVLEGGLQPSKTFKWKYLNGVFTMTYPNGAKVDVAAVLPQSAATVVSVLQIDQHGENWDTAFFGPAGAGPLWSSEKEVVGTYQVGDAGFYFGEDHVGTITTSDPETGVYKAFIYWTYQDNKLTIDQYAMKLDDDTLTDPQSAEELLACHAQTDAKCLPYQHTTYTPIKASDSKDEFFLFGKVEFVGRSQGTATEFRGTMFKKQAE